MEIRELLASRPLLHRDHLGRPAYFAIAEDVAALIDREVSPASRTLETGAGLSTVAFAIKGSRHTSVVPDAGLVDRILEFCKRESIPTDNLSFEVGRSEDVLPRIKPDRLDLVLIDGAHAFPIPFLDWFYAARNGLRDGGLLVVDDTQLWTGRVLVEFLAAEPNWSVEQQMSKSTVFRRSGDPFLGDWTAQLYPIYDGDVETAQRMRRVVTTLRKMIPDGSAFVAIDEAQLLLDRLGMFERRRPIPFLEIDGRYAGKPPDDATAVAGLDRLRDAGATHLVVLWPAFWWLDHYEGFTQHVNREFPRLWADDLMVLFDLRVPVGAATRPDRSTASDR